MNPGLCYKGKPHQIIVAPNGWTSIPHCARCGKQYFLEEQ